MAMGPDNQLHEMTDEFVAQHPEAQSWPMFTRGEEVEIKGRTFIISDIAPGQIKLKPKRAVA
jgi:hypothetical protein